MRNKFSDKERFLHIIDSIEKIEEFTLDVDYKTYMEDFKLRLALVKLIEIIGEATYGISTETQNKFSEIEWTVLKGIRNILVHEYFGIDYDIIWTTIKTSIPELKVNISNIINEI